jgi:general secretion pathway protein E
LRPLLRGVLVQRLVRTICSSCKGDGCERCLYTGYAGRTVVAECALFRNEMEVDRAINGEKWWPTMVSDALGKIKNGETTAEEVYRVFQSEIDNQDEALEGLELLTKEIEINKAKRAAGDATQISGGH